MTAPAGHDTVLVVDFGAQYAQLIARRVREEHVYSEIVPSSMSAAEMMARSPAASSSPAARSRSTSRRPPPRRRRCSRSGIPVLGICYGAQLLAQLLGGQVARTGTGEFGRTELRARPGSVLMDGWDPSTQVWMSHGTRSCAPRRASP